MLELPFFWVLLKVVFLDASPIGLLINRSGKKVEFVL